MFRLLVSLLVIAFMSFPLISQEIVTDRPDQTESATAVPKNAFQLESGILVSHEGEDFREILSPTNLFRYGLFENLELRLTYDFMQLKSDEKRISQTGFGDIQAGFKYQFYRNGKTEIAILSHLVFPSGTGESFSQGSYASINKLAIAHTLSDRFNLSYNLGYDYFDKGVFTYSLALGIGLNDKIGYYIESYGEADNEAHLSNMDTGFTYLLNDTLQFDFSFGTGINVDMNYLSIGVSWLILDKNEN
ncbi:MAG: transporter [Bacteroidia bacterium]|nr:transporter [Bacteroidia bacterium]